MILMTTIRRRSLDDLDKYKKKQRREFVNINLLPNVKSRQSSRSVMIIENIRKVTTASAVRARNAIYWNLL